MLGTESCIFIPQGWPKAYIKEGRADKAQKTDFVTNKESH